MREGRLLLVTQRQLSRVSGLRVRRARSSRIGRAIVGTVGDMIGRNVIMKWVFGLILWLLNNSNNAFVSNIDFSLCCSTYCHGHSFLW